MIRQRLATGMCGRKWTVDPVGEVVMADVAEIHLEKIDRRWPELRPETDLTINWRWTQIAASKVEAFTLLNRDEEPVAIWCSQRKRPLVLPAGNHYRLDFAEIDPTSRKSGFGRLVFGIIAERALELGAVGLVLGTWDTHVRYYESLGGREELAQGWTGPANCRPFRFDQTALQRLKEKADEFATR
jgi:GNAT superfamily N-acetyltransferase